MTKKNIYINIRDKSGITRHNFLPRICDNNKELPINIINNNLS